MLQSGFWGSFKASHGWTPFAFRVTAGEAAEFGLLVLTRRLFGVITLAYVPFGPVRDPASARGEMLVALAAALRPHLPGSTFVLRFDLPWEKGGESPGATRGAGGISVRKAASDIQPPSTVLVDLTPQEDEILAAMKPKTRYNVRLAEKKGVTVTEGSADDVSRWYSIYQETATYGHFGREEFAWEKVNRVDALRERLK